MKNIKKQKAKSFKKIIKWLTIWGVHVIILLAWFAWAAASYYVVKDNSWIYYILGGIVAAIIWAYANWTAGVFAKSHKEIHDAYHKLKSIKEMR